MVPRGGRERLETRAHQTAVPAAMVVSGIGSKRRGTLAELRGRRAECCHAWARPGARRGANQYLKRPTLRCVPIWRHATTRLIRPDDEGALPQGPRLGRGARMAGCRQGGCVGLGFPDEHGKVLEIRLKTDSQRSARGGGFQGGSPAALRRPSCGARRHFPRSDLDTCMARTGSGTCAGRDVPVPLNVW
jgi:hypothetical protein